MQINRQPVVFPHYAVSYGHVTTRANAEYVTVTAIATVVTDAAVLNSDIAFFPANNGTARITANDATKQF